MFFAFPKLFFRSKSNNEKGGKKAKFTRLIKGQSLCERTRFIKCIYIYLFTFNFIDKLLIWTSVMYYVHT